MKYNWLHIYIMCIRTVPSLVFKPLLQLSIKFADAL